MPRVGYHGADGKFQTVRYSMLNSTLLNELQKQARDLQGPDAFVTKFNNNGRLAYSTYLGGNGADEGRGIAVDSSGHAYVIGKCASSNFPFTHFLNAFGEVLVPGIFIAKFSELHLGQ
jgi:hypothetical protein